ncbi:hypothetical protein ABZ605_18170 [Streptomyces sp. NPDC012765]|uniref:hypothetical protein n=1 Tax=Streptomyces sp. NPDC012765 TaxID=3155249 RepID=UPI00341178DB
MLPTLTGPPAHGADTFSVDEMTCNVREFVHEQLHDLLHGSRMPVAEPEGSAREVAAFVLADNG